MSHPYPVERLHLFVEPVYQNENVVGFVAYFPFSGMMETKSQAMIQLEYIRTVVITNSLNVESENYVLEKTMSRFSNYFPVKYVVDISHFDIRQSESASMVLSKFQFELLNLLPHIRDTLKTKKEKILFCEMDSIPSLQTSLLQSKEIIQDESKMDEKVILSSQGANTISNIETHIISQGTNIVLPVESHVLPPLAPPPPPKIQTIWTYQGYLGNPQKPSPWDAFASHLESEKDGGYCRGQWDGHLNEKAITLGVPYGIVHTNGNRDKIQDILSCKLLSSENPLFTLFNQLLEANNSHERIQLVKDYLDEQGLKYNDESFWIQQEGKPIVKQTFFKAVITPLVHKTPKFQYYLKKKKQTS